MKVCHGIKLLFTYTMFGNIVYLYESVLGNTLQTALF